MRNETKKNSPSSKPGARIEKNGQNRAAIIYNPTKVDLDALRKAVALEESLNGWMETVWWATSEDDPGEEVGRRAINHPVDLVLVAGGDGTVSAVADSLRGSKIPLAIIPSGTGNLLARNLLLTLDDLQYSVNAAFSGDDRDIDIGVVEVKRENGSTDRHAFLVMAGVGIDAKMIENTDPELKSRIGWLAYLLAIFKALQDKSQLRFRYTFDETDTGMVRAHSLIIGNCGTLPGNIWLLPDAAIDDGLFDIVFLRPQGYFGWVQIWIKVALEYGVVRRTKIGRKLLGNDKEIRALRYNTATTFSATFDQLEVIELDGDTFGKTTELCRSIEPKALTVRIPFTK